MTIQKVSKVVGGISMLGQGLAQTFFSNMPDFREAYQKLQKDVVKGLYRNGQWACASKYYEDAGKYYSAMYCLHKAIETKDGTTSEHYKNLAQLYSKVKHPGRAKRYMGYYWYQVMRENRSYTTSFFRRNNINLDISQMVRDFGETMYEDHETFNKSLEIYVSEKIPQLALAK